MEHSALIGLQTALDQMTLVLDGVESSALDRPTPCHQWDVRRLADHAVDDLNQFRKPLSGGRPDFSTPPPRIEGDLGAAFRPGADQLVQAWREIGDLDRPMPLPIGERPASFVVRQQTAEFAVHAWDLARATRQPIDWDHDVAGDVLVWARGALLPAFRGPDGEKPFGPIVQPPPDATPQEQLVAFFGRPPRERLAP